MPGSGAWERLYHISKHVFIQLHPGLSTRGVVGSTPLLPGVVRTPEREFDIILTDFPFQPKYVFVGSGLRMAHIDEGLTTAKTTFLLLHGEPTYSYLYRKVIPLLVAGGHRVVVPDLIGFGRSDKLTDPMQYTFEAHLKWLANFVEILDLRELTCFGHEWGAMLGLALLARNEWRFDRMAIGNTHLIVPGNQPPWDLLHPHEVVDDNSKCFLARRVFCPLEIMAPENEVFCQQSEYIQEQARGNEMTVDMEYVGEPLYFDTEDFDPGQVVNDLSLHGIDEQSLKAYNAPFPSSAFKAGLRRFPMLVPRTLDDPCMAIARHTREKLGQMDKPFLTAFAPAKPLLDWAHQFWQEFVPGARHVAHAFFEHSGHFIQEDQGERLAVVLNKFVESL